MRPQDGLAGARAGSALQGARFSVLGDSISTLGGCVPDGWRVHYEGEVSVAGVQAPGDTWWGRAIAHFGGHLVANSSYSGSVVEGFGFPAGCSERRVRALLGPDGAKPDAVLVLMGINDYGWGGGRNQVMGKSLSATAAPEELGGWQEVVSVVGPEALARFRSAYAGMLAKVAAIAPGAAIWCVTLAPGAFTSVPGACFKHRIRGIDFDAYNQAIRDAAVSVCAQVADIRAYGVCYDAVDGVHPSAQGMRQIAAMVIDQMEGGAPDAASLLELRGAVRDERRCFKGSCAGCPQGDPSPERWTLHCAKA